MARSRFTAFLPLTLLLASCGGGGGGEPFCPRTSCLAAGKNCGTIADGCGGTVECGKCPAGESCGGEGAANVCGVGTCTPKSCEDQGADCGMLSDGCGALLRCGDCQAPLSCGATGMANVCGCAPKDCLAQRKSCGMIDDGCGHPLSCGTCTPPEVCGGGGVANVCGRGTCTPKTCMGLGATCGMVSDGCNTLLNCGSCQPPASCGGGGMANVCGCTPKSCQGLGKDCGAVSDGCGGMLACGSCQAPDTCGGGGTTNVCGCTPKSCLAQGKDCGAVPDGCGVMLACGSCQMPDTCGGGGVPNVCGGACLGGCPLGYRCASGACTGGMPNGLVLDVKTFTVAGRVTLNGMPPIKTCNTASPGTVIFTESTLGYVLSLAIPCDANFPFTGEIYPGTYRVSVVGTSLSNLPQGSAYVVNPALAINGPQPNLILDVKTYTVDGRVTLNGMPPIKTCNTASPGTVIFTEAKLGYNLSLTIPCDANFPFTGEIYPGTYRVSVVGTSLSNLPQGSAYVVNPALAINGPQVNLVLDVKTFTVAGRVTLNGMPPIKTCNTASPGTVIFVEPTLGYVLSLAIPCDANFPFTGEIYPGTYQVSVVGTSLSNLPQGSPYVVNPALAINGPQPNLTLDVKTFPVAGRVTLNGMPPIKTCNTASPGTVIFTEPKLGYNLSLAIPCDANFPFTGEIYPGTYRVSVVGTSLSNLPQGSAYVVNPALAINGPQPNLILDVKTFTVSGNVTLNGMPPIKTCNTASPGTVIFTETNLGYVLSLTIPCDAAFPFQGEIYPGTYHVSVVGTSLSNLPQGSAYVVNPALAVNASRAGLILDVRTVSISGVVTLNGMLPIKTCNTASPATVLFDEQTLGYHLSLTVPCDPTFPFMGEVYPGVYRISVVGTSLSNLPQGSAYVVYERLEIK